MARPHADPRGRLAVLGATSPAGGHLKAALADQGVAGDRVDLYGHAREVAVLSEYDGEARLVQPVDEMDAGRHAAVFVCEAGHDGEALIAAAAAGTLVVDLSGTIGRAALAGSSDSPGHPRLVAVPHPISLLLAPVLRALDDALRLKDVSATVLRPAADFGPPGLEELREQTVHLLRFESTPTDVFGRQLAFSVIPEHLAPEGESEAGARVEAECRALLGAPELPITVSTAVLPVFLGHAIALHVAVERGGPAEARAALDEAAGVAFANDPGVGTNLDAPEDPGVLVSRVDATARGRLRLWLLGSDPGAIAAARALDVASAAGILVTVS